MISHIQLKDFQCHKKLLIKFARVTSITGSSGRGKSAVLRALRVTCFNAPGAYGRRGTDGYRISLQIDGRTFIRIRRNARNVYRLDGRIYAALGKGGVPEAVAGLVNVHALNFQSQHDAPFLFTESPGQVSKRLNEVVNLEAIDAAMTEVASRVRKEKAVVEVTEERYKEAKAKLDELKWVPEFVADLARVESLAERLARNRDKTLSLASIISECKSARLKRDNAGNARLDGMTAVSAGRAATRKAEARSNLGKLIQEVKTAKATAGRPVPDLGDVLEVRVEADKHAERRRYLEELVEQTAEAKEKSECLRKELAEKESRLVKVRKKRKVCPTCKRPLPS